jgi:hypothetical protein
MRAAVLIAAAGAVIARQGGRFSGLDGFGARSGNWGGYWGKQAPELLEHRLAL